MATRSARARPARASKPLTGSTDEQPQRPAGTHLSGRAQQAMRRRNAAASGEALPARQARAAKTTMTNNLDSESRDGSDSACAAGHGVGANHGRGAGGRSAARSQRTRRPSLLHAAGAPQGARRRHQRLQRRRRAEVGLHLHGGPRADVWVPVARRALFQDRAGTDLVWYANYATERSIDPQFLGRGEVYIRRITLFARRANTSTPGSG